MKVLGPAILDHCQQKDIEAGKASLLIGFDRVFADAAARARVGDLWWVKEDFWEIKGTQYGPGPLIYQMVPGSVLGVKWPADIDRNTMMALGKKRRPPKDLIRCDSRATLKITAIEPKGFRCSVHMQNVDLFLREAA